MFHNKKQENEKKQFEFFACTTRRISYLILSDLEFANQKKSATKTQRQNDYLKQLWPSKRSTENSTVTGTLARQKIFQNM